MCIIGDSTDRDKTTLLEFPVTPSTECSRVSSRSYVFTLDMDSLLVTFANEIGKFVKKYKLHQLLCVC